MRGPIPPTRCWLRLTESISASGTPTINSCGGAGGRGLGPGREPRALHLRSFPFSAGPVLSLRSACLFSRYEGLFTRGASVESRILKAASAQITGPTPEQWRRLLPLCRRTATAPKPAVWLIVGGAFLEGTCLHQNSAP